jgi:hypothetical protein
VALALVLALLLPTAVQGEEDPVPSFTGFALQASNGYVFVVIAAAPAEEEEEEEEEERIGLFLVHGRRTVVAYSAPARVSSSTIDADLGALGRISVTRVPTGRTKTVRRGCKPGRTRRVEAERYEGIIEFHGEEGFTEVSATSAPLYPMRFCISSIEEGGEERELPGARLDAERRYLDKYRLEFDATQMRPGARTEVRVEVEEHRGEMEIYRATSILASAGTLRYDRRLRTATVRPPAPFAGHGSFHGNARRPNQWTGNLTVDLPGRSDVPVTGRGFWASLERPRR